MFSSNGVSLVEHITCSNLRTDHTGPSHYIYCIYLRYNNLQESDLLNTQGGDVLFFYIMKTLTCKYDYDIMSNTDSSQSSCHKGSIAKQGYDETVACS